MVHKLTIDGGLLRDTPVSPAVQTLQTWAAEGKIELFESDRAKDGPTQQTGWPGATTPPAFVPPRFRAQRKNNSKGLSFQQLAGILFPHRDSSRLTITEVNAVVHLQQHHALARQLYVTTNLLCFVDEGKREHLKSAFKIVVMTPDEAVASLAKSESWEAPELDAPKSKRGTR